MKAFNKLMGIFGILMIIAAAAPVEAFACVTESGNDSNPIQSDTGTGDATPPPADAETAE